MFTGFRSGEILHPTDLTARKHNRQIHQHILDWFSPSPNGFNQHIVLIFSTRRCSVRFLPEQFFFFLFQSSSNHDPDPSGTLRAIFFSSGKIFAQNFNYYPFSAKRNHLSTIVSKWKRHDTFKGEGTKLGFFQDEDDFPVGEV